MAPAPELKLLIAALRFEGGLSTPALLPGLLPQGAPVPLPGLRKLLGSIETKDPGDYRAHLYFQALPSEQGDDFVRQVNAALRGAGWCEPDWGALSFSPSGFQASDFPPFPDPPLSPPDPPMTLLHDAAKLAAAWDLRPEGQLTHLRLTLSEAAYSHWSRRGLYALPVLPRLSAPPGWTLHPLNSGASGNGQATTASTSALLRGTGPGAQAHAYFTSTLSQAGWQQQSDWAADGVVGSAWQGPEAQTGLLTLVRQEPELWQASLTSTQFSRGEGGEGSWFSF